MLGQTNSIICSILYRLLSAACEYTVEQRWKSLESFFQNVENSGEKVEKHRFFREFAFPQFQVYSIDTICIYTGHFSLFAEVSGRQQPDRPLDGIPGIPPVPARVAVIEHSAEMGRRRR